MLTIDTPKQRRPLNGIDLPGGLHQDILYTRTRSCLTTIGHGPKRGVSMRHKTVSIREVSRVRKRCLLVPKYKDTTPDVQQTQDSSSNAYYTAETKTTQIRVLLQTQFLDVTHTNDKDIRSGDVTTSKENAIDVVGKQTIEIRIRLEGFVFVIICGR